MVVASAAARLHLALAVPSRTIVLVRRLSLRIGRALFDGKGESEVGQHA